MPCSQYSYAAGCCLSWSGPSTAACLQPLTAPRCMQARPKPWRARRPKPPWVTWLTWQRYAGSRLSTVCMYSLTFVSHRQWVVKSCPIGDAGGRGFAQRLSATVLAWPWPGGGCQPAPTSSTCSPLLRQPAPQALAAYNLAGCPCTGGDGGCQGGTRHEDGRVRAAMLAQLA